MTRAILPFPSRKGCTSLTMNIIYAALAKGYSFSVASVPRADRRSGNLPDQLLAGILLVSLGKRVTSSSNVGLAWCKIPLIFVYICVNYCADMDIVEAKYIGTKCIK